MTSKTHHVVPNSGRGGWDVKRGGSSRSSGHFNIKQDAVDAVDAVDAAREISRNQRTELKVHNRNGQIAESDSHGRDPFPPKG